MATMNLDEGAQSTQAATHDIADPRHLGIHNWTVSAEDLSDIICFLIPISDAAKREVARLASDTSCALHIVQVVDVHARDLDDDAERSGQGRSVRPPDDLNDHGAHAIALRLSAQVKNPLQGFRFGRNRKHCDVYFANDPLRRMSNVHFCILINELGVLTVQDLSTNGTLVDDVLLQSRAARPSQAMTSLKTGSKITIVLSSAPSDISFRVFVPQREDEYEKMYRANLKAYQERLAVLPEKQEELLNDGAPPQHLRDKMTQRSVDIPSSEWCGQARYQKTGILGKSAFATVYQVVSKIDGQLYAAKLWDDRRFMRNGTLAQQNIAVLRVIRKTQHPNIVRFIELYEWSGRNAMTVMEFVPGGDLDGYVHSNGSLLETDARTMARQLLDALGCLHRNLIVHRNVQPSNILIYSHQPFAIRLTGFDLSELRENDQARLRTFAGTLLYCAPEVYPEFSEYSSHDGRTPHSRFHQSRHAVVKRSDPSYDHAIDVWSLGASLFFALTGKPPFQITSGMSYPGLLHRIMTNPLDTSPLSARDHSKDCIHVISQMLQRRPENRATVDSLQGHPWVIGLDPSRLPDLPAPPEEVSDGKVQVCYTLSERGPERSAIPEVLELVAPLSDSGYGTASSRAQPGPPNKVTTLGQGESYGQKVELELDDNETVYSDTSSLSDRRVESYSSKFVDDLVARLDLTNADEAILDKLAESLPALLQALASKIGHQAPSQMNRDVMVFLYRNRDFIAKSFRNTCLQNHEILHVEPDVTFREPPATEVMDRWLSAPDTQEYEDIDDVTVNEQVCVLDDGVANELSIPGLEEYHRLVSSDPGYDWLLNCLRMDTILERPLTDNMRAIQNGILQAIPKSRYVSRKTPTRGCTVTYTIDWDPFAFLADQGYEDPDHEALAKAITVTGLWRDAQALTCQEYLAQTWPLSGPLLLQLIKKLVRNREDGVKYECQTRNGTRLSACLDRSCLLVEASGVPAFVAEIGGQLAWLGAALRPSDPELSAGLVCCVPLIHEINHIANDNGQDYLTCSIGFSLREATKAPQNVAGQCWHAMFNRPVIAEGFPIPRRPEGNTGLEISLEMMAALADARSVDVFHSKVFIKGFSTMLVPTKRLDTTIIWHLVYNPGPHDRISYLDCPVKHQDIQLPELESARHIVGWCPEADCNIGTRSANYSVKKSGLPGTYSGCALEKVEIQGGQFIMGTASFSVGNREKPVHISRSGYMNKMQWISSKHVIFWDEAEKRGWLVNGARALLHLLRASLEYSKAKFKSAFLLDPKDLADIASATGSQSALDALLDQKNRTLPLYVDKTEVYEEETRSKIAGVSTVEVVTKRHTRHYRLEDRVEHIYNVMEKLIDHQADIERRSGLQMKPRPRRQLEGWDFRDLVTDGDPFFPKVSTLQTIGKGWVDLTRAIHAVCLFGRGFGDMIQPRQKVTNVCTRWSRLPVDRYYLAACVSDIKEIIDSDGDGAVNPMKICDGMLWHMKQTMFQACPCTKDATSKHHDPVQVLFPKSFTSLLKPKPQVGLEDRGAVIFGHNMNLHWHWRDHDGPVKGDPPLVEPAAVSTSDSSVGSILESSQEPSSSSGVDGSRSSSDKFLSSDTTPSSIPSAELLAPGDGVQRPVSETSTDLEDKKPAGSKRPLLELKLPVSSIYKRLKSKK